MLPSNYDDRGAAEAAKDARIAALEAALAKAEVALASCEPEIAFTYAEAVDLVECFGGDESTEITVIDSATGHSGPGLYAYTTDYPDEGSTFLGPEARKDDTSEEVKP